MYVEYSVLQYGIQLSLEILDSTSSYKFIKQVLGFSIEIVYKEIVTTLLKNCSKLPNLNIQPFLWKTIT